MSCLFLAIIPVGQGEGGVDPAVGVHDSLGDVVDDAVDGVADEGLGGNSIGFLTA